MSSIAISLIVLACVFGGAAAGVLLRGSLPPQHLSADSRNAVNLGMGLVATMSALVLGLLVSSAKNFYDTQSSELTEMSAKTIFLDRVLAHYGPETKPARELVRAAVVDNLDTLWPQERTRTSGVRPPSVGVETLLDKIQELSPKDDMQRSLQGEAMNLAITLGQMRWLMFEQRAGSLSTLVLLVLVSWLTAIFVSFGLFAPRNATVTSALFFAGLSVSGAVLLILEMYSPYDGLIHVSSAPLRLALAHLGQ